MQGIEKGKHPAFVFVFYYKILGFFSSTANADEEIELQLIEYLCGSVIYLTR